MKKLSITIGIIVGLLVATNIQSSAQDEIYGCVNSRGILRIVGGPDQCNRGESEISWNQTGPVGPPGPPGSPGDPGPPGPTGAGGILVQDSLTPTAQDLGILVNCEWGDGQAKH
jgi:hypothetical protein